MPDYFTKINQSVENTLAFETFQLRRLKIFIIIKTLANYLSETD